MISLVTQVLTSPFLLGFVIASFTTLKLEGFNRPTGRLVNITFVLSPLIIITTPTPDAPFEGPGEFFVPHSHVSSCNQKFMSR